MARIFLIAFLFIVHLRAEAADVRSFFFFQENASVEVNVRAFSRWLASLSEDERSNASALFGCDFPSMKKALEWTELTDDQCVAYWWFFEHQDARSKESMRKYFLQNAPLWQQKKSQLKNVPLVLFTHDRNIIKCSLEADCKGFEVEGFKPADASFKMKKGKVKFPAPQILTFRLIDEVNEYRVRCLDEAWFDISLTDGFAPIVKSFFASETNIIEGNRTALTWVVLGADSVFLDNGIGRKPGRWQVFISPYESTLYSLNAENAFGGASVSIQVGVTYVQLAGMNMHFFQSAKIPGKPKEAIVEIKIFNGKNEEVLVWRGGEGQDFGKDCSSCGPFLAKATEHFYKRDLMSGRCEIRLLNASQTWAFLPRVVLMFDNFEELVIPFTEGSVQELSPGEVIEVKW